MASIGFGDNAKEVEVLYNDFRGEGKPTQGYEDDFAYDIYTKEDMLVPPLTFKSVQIDTGLRTAFNAKRVGMKANLRSGIAANTPLILSNSTGIIEGTYRDTIKMLVRNTFIDNRLVEFAMDVKGNRVNIHKISILALKKAKKFYLEETDLLGYEGVPEETLAVLFKNVIPAGTVYIPKGTRIAQIHFSERIKASFTYKDILPDSARGANGLGSSGVERGK